MLEKDQLQQIRKASELYPAHASCIEQTAFIYNLLQAMYEVSPEEITICAIPTEEENQTLFVHVWIEIAGEWIDSMHSRYEHIVQQAYKEGKVEKNPAALSFLIQSA